MLGLSAVHRLSLAAASRACFALWCVGFSLQWLLCGFTQAPVPEHPMAVMQGLVLTQHGGSSRIRDQTSVHCIARRALNHWKSHITMWLFTVLVSVPQKKEIRLEVLKLSPRDWSHSFIHSIAQCQATTFDMDI